jgi:hypothetical protein
MNIKPFMLFLLYATIICVYGVANIYHMACRHELKYISFMKLMPVGLSGFHLDPDMMNMLSAMAEKQKDPNSPGAVLKIPKHGLFGSSPLGSIRSFLDFCTFAGLTALTGYVAFIFGMVTYFVHNNTSLVERLKRQQMKARGQSCEPK